MYFINLDFYNWVCEMETTCKRSFEVEYMRVFEMDNGVRIVIENDDYVAYTREKCMGVSG